MSIYQSKRKPEDGIILLRTLAMPANTNANGDIFGGWIMSQMDLAGGILAKEIAQGRIVTVSVENITFLHPVAVGDVVCCYGKCLSVGRSSIKLQLSVWAKKVSVEPIGKRFHVTEAIFTYVAVDKNGKSRPVPRENNPELERALSAQNPTQPTN